MNESTYYIPIYVPRILETSHQIFMVQTYYIEHVFIQAMIQTTGTWIIVILDIYYTLNNIYI